MLPTAARKLDFSDVPIIDLGLARSGDERARRALAQTIGDACSRVGFFYVINHGIAASDITAIFQTSKDFHDLPLDVKMQSCMRDNDHFQGYLPGLTKSNDKRISQTLQEAFQFRRPLAPDDPDLIAGKPLCGTIPWPRAMPDLEPRMMRYFHKVDVLAGDLLALFEMSLDLPPNIFARFFRKDMNQLRLLHYPPQPPDGPGDYRGTRDHTDTDCFTILALDMTGGLEIRNKDGEWIAVPPIENSFVINVGEISESMDRRHFLLDRPSRHQPLRSTAVLDSLLHVSDLRRIHLSDPAQSRSRQCRPRGSAELDAAWTSRSTGASSRRATRRASTRSGTRTLSQRAPRFTH